MKKLLFFALLALCYALPTVALAVEKSVCNPQPMEGDLVLPGPKDTCFAFRAIQVRGESPYSGGMSFIMGDAEEENFRMRPTKVMVGGSFFSEGEEPLWMYYLSKYEITRGQYRAVMGALPAALTDKEASAEKDSLPVTNLTYFEAIQFIDALNQWFYANGLDALPKSNNYPGFVRLPSEAEWEFAARGGIKVEKSLFESATPYDDQVAAYEWFNGPTSSHGKMKPIGLLKANPLGLHDMLGNVQEMTSSQYQFRYYEGRSGGFTSRGGSYIMNEEKLLSAQRQEEPYYLLRRGNEVKPNAKITLGMRLTLSAPLLTDRETIAEIEEAFEEELDSAVQPQTPATLSMAPLSDQAEASFVDAMKRIQSLNKLSKDEHIQVNWAQELAYALDGMQKGQKAQHEADIRTATTWVNYTHSVGQRLRTILEKYAYMEGRLKEDKEKNARLEKPFQVAAFNINEALETYSANLMGMEALPTKLIQDAFAAREKATQNYTEKGMKPEEIAASLAVLQLIKAHYTDFVRNKRTNIPKWRKDYENSLK